MIAARPVPPLPKGPLAPKPKVAPQAKTLVEEDRTDASSVSSAHAQEALMAEAAKILKGVSLKPLRVDGGLWGA